MSLHLLKLRIRRFWRRQVTRTVGRVQASGEFVERQGLSRVSRLRSIWRFLVLWLGLWGLLVGALIVQFTTLRPYYQTLQPVSGGHYTEGIAGVFTTASPLYAVSDVDTSVSRLLFSSLLTYDAHDQLVGDLAESWQADPTGKVYTITLRPNLRWHDGRLLTATDVVYTYQTIQNPDAQSPLFSSWRGITVTAVNDRIISFVLPNPLSSFPSSLVNGIVPKHVLESILPVELRSASFNTASPIGSGPFTWKGIGVTGSDGKTQAQISLAPFAHYWAGKPALSSVNIYAYADAAAMVRAYQNQEITAMTGLTEVPKELAKDAHSHIYNLPMSAGVYVFFRHNAGVLIDQKVRQALVLAASRTSIIKSLDYQTAIVDEPFLKNQWAYDPASAQVTDNIIQARALLDTDGWVLDSKGQRVKNGQLLTFTLSANDTSEYKSVAEQLQSQWKALGVTVRLALQPPADFQGTLSGHMYDAALYGISIGIDPDVFVYWDSSQADPRSATRLNFSEYNSAISDLSLEAGRTRLDQGLRIAKYKPFLRAWQQDAPALGLYQPRLLFISHEKIYGLSDQALSTDADRYRNVENWMIHLGWVTNP